MQIRPTAFTIGLIIHFSIALFCVYTEFGIDSPFLIWGKYRKKLFHYYLPLSFQFHHTQMDGAHAGRFLENLQKAINNI